MLCVLLYVDYMHMYFPYCLDLVYLENDTHIYFLKVK